MRQRINATLLVLNLALMCVNAWTGNVPTMILNATLAIMLTIPRND